MTKTTDTLARLDDISTRLDLGGYSETPDDPEEMQAVEDDVRLLMQAAQPAIEAAHYPPPELWNQEDFRRWLKGAGFTHDQAASALGISKRQVTYMVSGEKEVRKRTALACLGVLTLQGLGHA